MLAVFFFVSNITKLAQTLRSHSDLTADQSQTKWFDLSARYMLLFGFAILSTNFFWILSLGFCDQSALRMPFWITDLVINLWCIYLQSSFAKTHYRRCCGICDDKFRKFRNKRTRHIMKIHN